MVIESVKRNLNKKIVYKSIADVYKLTGCILRKGENGFYYQAELLDTLNGNSLIICKLDDIEEDIQQTLP